jgi:hypothetical protein
MSDELVKRLRMYKCGARDSVTGQIDSEAAADLIEQQAARIAELEAQLAPVAPAVDAQPVAWLVTGGKTFVDRAFITEAHADKSIAERKDGAHKVPLGRIDAAQSEGLRKDAERYRWLVERFTGYDFDWMPSEPDADDGKSVVVFDVGREFRGGRDITAAIDAALSKHKAGEKE